MLNTLLKRITGPCAAIHHRCQTKMCFNLCCTLQKGGLIIRNRLRSGFESCCSLLRRWKHCYDNCPLIAHYPETRRLWFLGWKLVGTWALVGCPNLLVSVSAASSSSPCTFSTLYGQGMVHGSDQVAYVRGLFLPYSVGWCLPVPHVCWGVFPQTTLDQGTATAPSHLIYPSDADMFLGCYSRRTHIICTLSCIRVCLLCVCSDSLSLHTHTSSLLQISPSPLP